MYMQFASVYEENHGFIAFADSGPNFLWSTTSGAARGGSSRRHLLEGGKLL